MHSHTHTRKHMDGELIQYNLEQDQFHLKEESNKDLD